MLELTPTGKLSWSYRIQQDGKDVSMLELSRFRSAGSFAFDHRRFDLKREGVFGALQLLENGRAVARAERKGFLSTRYLISADDRQLTVVATGFLSRSAQIVHGDVAIGNIRRASIFRRNLTVEVFANAPAPLVIFCTAIMILHWRNVARAARS